MEVVVPVMAPSAPCSPRTAAAMSGGGDLLPGGFHYFFSSAPTSPSRASSYTADDLGGGGDATAFDFAFGFSGQLHESRPILVAADELFEGGRIRPLNGPHHQSGNYPRDFDGEYVSPRSPRRLRTTPAARGGGAGESESAPADQNQTRGRSGRPAVTSSSSSVSSRSRRATRSLSPYRGDSLDDDEFPSSPPSPRGGAASLMRGCGSGSRKWRLKDLFLFRSASEGSATRGGKDPLLKYSMLKSGAGGGDGSASMRIKGRGSAASASDMAPYTVSRAAAEEMRRRTTTPLPFHRNSLFGYLRSNPAIHTISRKLGSYSSSNRARNASSTPTPAAAAASSSGYQHA